MSVNAYPVGTTVFAKLKGYPWWPARIEDDADLPINVSTKKPKVRPIWPVFFFGSRDYGWFGPSELKEFDPVVAERSRKAHKKDSALEVALREALDPSLLEVHPGVSEPEEEEFSDQEQVPPKKKAAAKKTGKASKVRARDASDSEQSPPEKKRRASASEGQPAKRKPTKKASRDDVQDEDEDDVPKKRAGQGSRSRQESDLKSADDDASVPDSSNIGRARKSEEDAGQSGDQNRAKKLGGGPNDRLLKLRHKLQKLLLVEGLSEEVRVQNVERADPFMSEVEAFDIDLKMLKETKIGRLMKKISALEFSSDRFKIVDRSLNLIKAYKSMMERNSDVAEAPSPGLAAPVKETATVVAEEVVMAPVEPAVENHVQEAAVPTPEIVAAVVEPTTVAPTAPEQIPSAQPPVLTTQQEDVVMTEVVAVSTTVSAEQITA